MSRDQKKLATFWLGLGCVAVFGYLSIDGQGYEMIFHLCFLGLMFYYYLVLRVIDEKVNRCGELNPVQEEYGKNKIYRGLVILFYSLVGLASIYLFANPDMGEAIGRNKNMLLFIFLLIFSPLLYPIIKKQIISYKELGKNGT